MNAYVQFANDYKCWPSVETITFRGSDVNDDRQIAYARRDETKRGRVALASETVLGDLVEWHLPDILLDGVEPELGDRIYVAAESEIDSGTELWMVHEASKVRFGTEWVIKATRFGASFLRHTVDVLKPTITRDTDTAATKESFAETRTKVPCWVRPATANESVAWFQEDSVAGYLVYFDSDPAVNTPHVLLFGDRYLAVQGYARNVDGLNLLWIVPCLG